MIRPNILKQQTDRAAIDAILTHALPKVFGYLGEPDDRRLSGGRRTFGIADIALACNLINYHYLGYRIDGHIRSSTATSKTWSSGHRSTQRCLRRAP